MKKLVIAFSLIAVLASACSRDYDALATFANAPLAQFWARQEPFYNPKSEIFIDSTNTWRSFTAFTVTSAAEPDLISFANIYNAGRGTNALFMRNIYDRLPGGLTNDSGYYNVTIPKVFQLVPANDSLVNGTVKVNPQDVRLFRRDKSSYIIRITGGQGTWDRRSELMEVTVNFDETAVGGPASIARRYRFRP